MGTYHDHLPARRGGPHAAAEGQGRGRHKGLHRHGHERGHGGHQARQREASSQHGCFCFGCVVRFESRGSVGCNVKQQKGGGGSVRCLPFIIVQVELAGAVCPSPPPRTRLRPERPVAIQSQPTRARPNFVGIRPRWASTQGSDRGAGGGQKAPWDRRQARAGARGLDSLSGSDGDGLLLLPLPLRGRHEHRRPPVRACGPQIGGTGIAIRFINTLESGSTGGISPPKLIGRAWGGGGNTPRPTGVSKLDPDDDAVG